MEKMGVPSQQPRAKLRCVRVVEHRCNSSLAWGLSFMHVDDVSKIS